VDARRNCRALTSPLKRLEANQPGGRSTFANGSATVSIDAGGGTRTRTALSRQRILSPLSMRFRHLWLANTQKLPESLEFLDRPFVQRA
jgi:hypothetical protein